MSAEPRPAATLVLVRDRGTGGPPEVLLVERTGRASFAAGALVFPGGVVEPEDASSEAAALSPALSAEDAWARVPDVETAESALGHYVAAVRETFEETAVLLAEPAGGPAPMPEELDAVRREVAEGPHAFLAWLAGAGLRLATDRLVYLAHWITPAGSPKRYDTRFFAAPMPEGAEAHVDGQELVAHHWLTPAEALALHRRGDARLMHPTRDTLERLAAFADAAAALSALSERDVPRMLPKRVRGPDGTARLLFPDDPDYENH